MLLPRLSHVWVLGLTLTATYAQLFDPPGPATTPEDSSPVDIAAAIDEVVEEWRAKYPDLKSTQLDKILATAEKAKTVFLATPAKARSIDLDTITLPSDAVPFVAPHRRQVSNSTMSMNSTLAEARRIVRLAQLESSARNRERFANPRVNTYWAHLDSQSALRARAEDMATFVINETVAIAAAIVAEADSAHEEPVELPPIPADILQLRQQMFGEEAGGGLAKRADGFWMENVPHIGRVPFGGAANNGYKVFRNVKDYGAKGDGKTDDTAAIDRAMKDQGRCGENCGASTIKPAIVYFPSGTYLVSTPIISYYNTQMVGDANNLPILKAAKSFVGLGVVSVDVYTGKNGGIDQWYINQNNFLRQLRNFIIDVRDADQEDVAGLHWQVAQATSIKNVAFYQSGSASKKHMGIFAENGSGGFMSDLTFIGGHIGMRCGNQQFTSRNMVFTGTRIGIDMLWDWGWTWKSLIISATENAIKMSGDYRGGSIMLLDSIIAGMTKGIYVTTPVGQTQSEKFSIALDNVQLRNVGTAVHHETAGITLAGGSRTIQSWVLGKVYDEKNPRGRYQTGPLPALHPTTGLLFKDGAYFEREKPQYESYSADTFINAREFAEGNGVADDSFGVHLAFHLGSIVNRPVYVPFGSYLITMTIHIPVGSVIVGECWAQLVATGGYFGSMDLPQVMVTIGNEGETGSVEIQDLMFTTMGPTPGAILAEWNMAESSQGSAAMWDTHFRIGGAQGTQLTVKDCPKLTGRINPKCIAGSMLMHLTPSSSAYLENVWAWVADHDFDSGPAQTQIDIYVARGILIESNGGPLWMYGTASEHCVFYQYLLYGAKDVYMGMLQTESPYYLPSPQAPAPFTSQLSSIDSRFPGDPDFKECPASEPHCAAAWGLMIVGSTNVHILGAGLYNWFIDYTQDCLSKQYCQKRVVNVRDSGQIWFYNLYTIGTWEMLNHKGSDAITATANTNANTHPFTSIINAWLIVSSGEGSLDDEDTLDKDHEYPYDDYEETIIIRDVPACDFHYESLEQIEEQKSRIPSECRSKYILDVLLAMMSKALKDYTEVVQNGYDKKFNVYTKLIKSQIPAQITEYMRGAHDSGTFRCTEHRLMMCTGPGKFACTPDIVERCNPSADCKPGTIRDFEINCPTFIKEAVRVPFDTKFPPSAITYRFANEDKFWTDLFEEYGILKDWVTIGDKAAYVGAAQKDGGDGVSVGCNFADPVKSAECLAKATVYWYNYPLYIESKVEIPNPGAMVKDSYDNIKSMYDRTLLNRDVAEWNPQDVGYNLLVDSISMPVMMMAQAVEEMRFIASKGEEIMESQRKAAILSFIGMALMIIPLAGRIASAVGGAALRAVLGMVGETAAAALAIYEVVDDPGNALFAILGLFLGGFSRQPFREAKQLRRNMRGTEFNKLPEKVRIQLNTIDRTNAVCSL